MQKARTWRELLGQITRDPRERQRIAQELHIHPLTLTRWANGPSKPRRSHLHRLLNAVPPPYRQELASLLMQDFGKQITVTEEQPEEDSDNIPSAFYSRVLSGNAHTPPVLRASSLRALILQQALAHLDPDKVGLSVTLVLCSPPLPGQNVRSLREIMGRGTPPWQSHLDNQVLLLGAESLAGFAVSQGRVVANQNINEGPTFFPVHRTPWEVSAAACPLLHGEYVAGCLLVSSTRANYFTEARRKLIERYSHLMALACDPQDFYPLSHIALGIMPSAEEQQPYFAQFQQRTMSMMLQSMQSTPVTRSQAEEAVWHELEEEFLQLALRNIPISLHL